MNQELNKKLTEKVEQKLEQISNEELNPNNLETLYKAIDIYKDIKVASWSAS